MTLPQLVFYFFALLTVVAALFILWTKNVLHAVLSLLAVFLGISAMYVFAGADFLAITQLVIYVGGVLVLMLFGVMLTNRETGATYPVSKNSYLYAGIGCSGLLASLLIYLFIENKNLFAKENKLLVPTEGTTVYSIGIQLMSSYLILFEIAGLLLLLALIGAAVVASNRQSEK